MARLPSAEDIRRPVPQPQREITTDRSGEVRGAAIADFGASVVQAGNQIYEHNTALARAKASNALLDHEIVVKTTGETIQRKVESGELPYDQAQKTLTDELAKIQQPDIQYADPLTKETLNRGVKRINAGAQTAMGGVVYKATQDDYRGQGIEGLDKLGKLSGMPRADIESLNQRAELLRPLLQKSGLKGAEVDKGLQDFKDKNWLNQATQRAMETKDNLAGIKAMEHDLTAADGFYAGKLDTDRRNAVLQSVINSRLVIENRIQHQADKREAMAERTLNAIDTQIASGTPATAQMWAGWEEKVKGTTVEGEFKQRVVDEGQVQEVLRKPVGEQGKFVQDKETSLDTQGGTMRDRANLNRLKSAVRANVKQMQETPLLFNANRTGQQVEPLDLSALAAPGGSPEVTDQIASRMASLVAMRKEYGTQIPLRPLLPQEAQQLTAVLDKSTPKQQTEIFASLHNAVGDTQAYKGVMQQIAPDAPVKALAGMLAAKQNSITLENHWFRPNDIAMSGDVAATMLQGEQSLNATKSQKTDDGKPKKSLYLPEDSTLQADFQDAVGSAFAGRSGAAQTAYQAVKAYYVGKAEQTGRLAASKKDIDFSLVQEAITATLGSVVDFNGQGQVLAPWGMDESTFEDRAQAAWLSQAKTLGMPEDIPRIGLRNQGDGTYYVVQGRNFLYGKDGHPVVIDVTK